MAATFRPATAQDAPDLARISMLASGGTFDLLLSGLKRNVSPTEVLEMFCGGESTEYSYKNFLVAEVDGHIAGGVNFLSVERRYELAGNINPLLEEKFDFGIYQLIKFFFRARHLKGMNELKVPSRNSLHVNDIAVFQQYEGQGIGKILMEMVIERAKAEARDFVSLYVWADNTRAIEFYKKLGFVIVRTADVRPHSRYLHHEQSHLMLLKTR